MLNKNVNATLLVSRALHWRYVSEFPKKSRHRGRDFTITGSASTHMSNCRTLEYGLVKALARMLDVGISPMGADKLAILA